MIKRGHVYNPRFPHASGRSGKKRPVVVVQADEHNQRLRHAVVVQLTTNMTENISLGRLPWNSNEVLTWNAGSSSSPVRICERVNRARSLPGRRTKNGVELWIGDPNLRKVVGKKSCRNRFDLRQCQEKSKRRTREWLN
jgi:hypothetical protein